MAFIYQIRLVILVFIGISTLCACSDSFMKSSSRSKTTALADLTTSVDSAGNVSAAFDPNSRSVQVLRLTSGTLAGSGVALPSGALSIPVFITVGEGETLAASRFTQQLGLGSNTVSAAGPSVSFIPSSNVQASSPFTLSIPFTRTSLALADSSSDNVIVMYRWMNVVGDNVTYEMGIIPRSEVTVSNSKVSFGTTKFGVFQIGVSDTKIEERIKIPTVEPPALKAEAGNPLVGSWSQCQSPVGTAAANNGGDASFGGLLAASSTDIGKFTSNTFAHIKQTFDGPNCTGNLLSTMTETGTYQLQPVDVPETIPINFTISTKVGTIYSDAGIAAANADPANHGCGLSDWVARTQKDLLNSTCAGTKTTDYSRIKIDGRKLYFCDHQPGTNYVSSPDNRVPNCNEISETDILQKN